MRCSDWNDRLCWALWGVAAFKSVALLSVAILFGGAAWTAIMSLMTTVMQNLAPDWLRARAMAVFMLVYMGTWTAGSAFWGYVAGREGTHFSLISAAIGTAVCPILVLISRLPDTPVDLGLGITGASRCWSREVDPSQGPVLVTVEYEVDPRRADEFLEALHKFARVRRRTEHQGGASIAIQSIRRTTSKRSSSNLGRSTCDSTSD